MRPFRAIQPALAALLAACVLLLGLAASSPRLHEELCAHGFVGQAHDEHEHHDVPAPLADDHACAVTLFAAGCDVVPTAIPLSPPLELSATRVAAFTEWMLARTLRGPERVCGPPPLA